MVFYSSKKRRGLLALAVGVLLVNMAAAQTSLAPSSASASAQPIMVKPSVFDGYKPYTDEPVANWKAANDSVAQIGGWREYARQAQQPDNMPGVAGKAVEATPKPDTPPTTKAKP